MIKRIEIPSVGYFFYLLLLIVASFMPSDGNHGLFSAKTLTFLSASFGAFIVLLVSRQNFFNLKLACFSLLSLTFLLMWFLWGYMNDMQHSEARFDQFKVFVVTIVFCCITVYYFKSGLLNFNHFLKVIVYSNLFYSLLKIAVLIMCITISFSAARITEVLGIRFITMDIVGGIFRLQTSVDILTPFLVFFVLQSEAYAVYFSRKFKIFYLLVSFLSIVLSFSRLLIFIYLLSFFFYVLASKPSRAIKGLVLSLIIGVAMIPMVGLDNIALGIEKRLFSTDNYASDNIRVEQTNALMHQYYESPFLGSGLGSYVIDSLRDDTLKHSYEVQWVAFLMQFGVFGIILLLMPLGYICAQIINYPISRLRVSVFCLFSLWLLSGFTNPYLISLTSGVVYSLFLLSSYQQLVIIGEDKNYT